MIILSFLCTAFLFSTPANAKKDRSLHQLTTGNGFGFQIYDIRTHKISAFFDSPTRFVSMNPKDPSADGPEHRNVIPSLTFGVSDKKGKWWKASELKTAKKGPGYLQQSHIISESLQTPSFTFTQNFFAPFTEERNLMVAVLDAPSAAGAYIDVDAQLGKTENTVRKIRAFEEVPGVFVETGEGPGVLVYAASANKELKAFCISPKEELIPLQKSEKCPKLRLQADLDKNAFSVAALYLENDKDLLKEARHLSQMLSVPPSSLLTNAIQEMEAWRKKPEVAFQNEDERELWRQSESVLRMAQLREENRPGRLNHGMILASLPPGQWSIAWVRDMTYAIVALARTGHFMEAKKALDSMLNAAPVGLYKRYVKNSNYRISVTRYSGDGAEQGDYSGDPTPNVEMDGWGLFLWASRQYLDFSKDLNWLKSKTREGTVYEALVEGVAQPLEENMENLSEGAAIMAADSSIWESHMSDARHYAFTTMAAARGLCDMASIAEKLGHHKDALRFRSSAKKLRLGFNRKFVHAKGVYGALERSKEKDIDSSTVEAITWNLFDEPEATPRLLTSVKTLKTNFGGYRRNSGVSDYEQHEFLWVDFKLAEAFRRQGKQAQAKELLNKIVRVSQANFGLIAENYNTVASRGPIGSYIYSFPMVGYGAGVFQTTLLDRDQKSIEDSGCGVTDLK